jgi:hypothetical protein
VVKGTIKRPVGVKTIPCGVQTPLWSVDHVGVIDKASDGARMCLIIPFL